MIPKIIHQIYWDYKGIPLSERPIFLESKKSLKLLHPIHRGWEYRLWNEKECDKFVLKYYEYYYDHYTQLRFKIQQIDFVRLLILHKYGGFYIDMDMIPLRSLDELIYNFPNTLQLHNVRVVQPTWSSVENDFMASTENNKFWMYAASYSQTENNRLKDNETYKVWKGRFVMQTTGPKMLSRAVKLSNPYDLKIHRGLVYTKHHEEQNISRDGYYFRDHKTNTWINDKKGAL